MYRSFNAELGKKLFRDEYDRQNDPITPPIQKDHINENPTK